MAENPPQITPVELKTRIDRGERLTVLDVREPHEWELNRIVGAVHIPMREIPLRLAELPKDSPIVCYCHHGGRSARVQELLFDNGFTNVINLDGGIHAWSLDVDPEVPTY